MSLGVFKVYNFDYTVDEEDGKMNRVYEQLDDVYYQMQVMFGRKPFKLPYTNVVPRVAKLLDKRKQIDVGHFPIKSYNLNVNANQKHKEYVDGVFNQQIDDIKAVFYDFFRSSTPTDNNTYDYLANSDYCVTVSVYMNLVYDTKLTGTQMAIALYKECKPKDAEEEYVLWVAITIILLIKRSSLPSNKI